MALLLVGASAADAHVVGEVGYHANPRPPGHALKHQTGILAPSPTRSPVPAVVPAPTVGGGLYWLSAAQVASYARAAGFPESVIPTMVAIAYRESHWNAHAVNLSSGACGLWQLYPCYGGIAWLDPMANARGAWAKYSADIDPGPGYTPAGLQPWGGAP